MTPSDLPAAQTSPAWRGWLREFTELRIAIASGLGVAVAIALNPLFATPLVILLGRSLFLSMVLLLVFIAAGRWRQRLVPRWLAQVVAVALAAPVATLAVYLVTTGGDWRRFVGSDPMLTGFVLTSVSTLVIGTVMALGALLRERDAQARSQALGFELERERLEKQAIDARLSLLQAQIEPHFLFNTLANIQALVEDGSPRAPAVLASLIAYLRAAMPRLHGGAPTLGDELTLVRAYLELMQMRMPDRLAWTIDVEPSLHAAAFPPMALLTLVENAVRHGIDPAEEGGRIEVGGRSEPDGGQRLWVLDNGVGLAPQAPAGTGLSNLRERMQACFGPRARMELDESAPHGLRVTLTLPPRGVDARQSPGDRT